jgi:TRAP-type C4-dicarboxylate transport system permease small subunit
MLSLVSVAHLFLLHTHLTLAATVAEVSWVSDALTPSAPHPLLDVLAAIVDLIGGVGAALVSVSSVARALRNRRARRKRERDEQENNDVRK